MPTEQVRVPVMNARPLASRIYATQRCAQGDLHCKAIRMGAVEWEYVCDRPAVVCVHLEIGPGNGIPARTAFCEEHSISLRHQPGFGRLVARMHSIPTGPAGPSKVVVTN